MSEALVFNTTVTAEGISPQHVTVNANAATQVKVLAEKSTPPEVIVEEPTPGANPQTGAIPYNVYALLSLLTLGAGMVVLKKRKEEQLKQIEIKILREDNKKVKSELHKAKVIFKKSSTKTNKNNLDRKKRVRNRTSKRIETKINEKTILKTKIEELETELFELKSTHCGLNKKQYKTQSKKIEKEILLVTDVNKNWM